MKKYGLGDIYYGLISFISSYVNKNFDPMEVLNLSDTKQSNYAIAIEIMKSSLKEIMDYLKNGGEVYLPQYNKSVNIETINIHEQLAIEERCKEYMIAKLNEYFNNMNLELNSNNRKF